MKGRLQRPEKEEPCKDLSSELSRWRETPPECPEMGRSMVSLRDREKSDRDWEGERCATPRSWVTSKDKGVGRFF